MLINLIFFLTSLTIFFFVFYQLPSVKNKVPWFSNHILAYKYERLAKKLPPTDLQAKRLRAMAEALRKGQKEYSFESGPVPGLGK